ncbi:urease accessory protein UreG [Candidatus Haliotispira prima]|uniref:Urease accessory protein UreG n=1 Tax=Candidatus Haliotispira prima TaxID=3034016 RepID=A0ABY8MJX0_9SPIO|nr:urease accessory protein UreG [Candidatus Haliotispira prima]
MDKFIKIGIGGPVGSGKTHFLLRLCEVLQEKYSIIAVTNDIYTREDAQFLTRHKALPEGRIMGVETGGCPHAAIRDDISLNMDAIELLYRKFPDADLAFVESGGDNLSATFSPDLVDYQIYIIDVAQGEDIPRKGGMGINRSDLLIVNKIDLAPYVDVNLKQVDTDLSASRGPLPFIFTNMKTGEGVDRILKWLESTVNSHDKEKKPLWSGRTTLSGGMYKEHDHSHSH